MMNHNLATKDYEIERRNAQEELTVAEAKAARASYLERSAGINMPVLKVSDLLDEAEKTDLEEKEVVPLRTESNIPLESALEILQSTADPESEQIEKPFELSIVPMLTYEMEELTNSVPQLDSNAKSQAYRIADVINEEVHKFWTSKNKIRVNINELNLRNAYSFVGYMITTSDSGTVLNDIKNYITYKEIVHIIVALSRQAKNAGLVDLTQYGKLKKEHDAILKNYGKNLNRKADNRSIRHINHVIEEMYQEMTKIY